MKKIILYENRKCVFRKYKIVLQGGGKYEC